MEHHTNHKKPKPNKQKEKPQKIKPQNTSKCADLSMRTQISTDFPRLFAFLTLHTHFSASLVVLANNTTNSWSWPQTAKPKFHSKIYSVYRSPNATSVKNIKWVFLLNYPLSKHKLYNSLKHFKKKAFKMHFLNYFPILYLHFIF